MSLELYHDVCYWCLCLWHQFPISTNVSVELGTIRRLSGAEYEGSFDIAHISGRDTIVVKEYNRTYINSSSHSLHIPLDIARNSCLTYDHGGTAIMENGWIRSQDYVPIAVFWSKSEFAGGISIFVLLAELQADIPTTFQIPDCPAYWSLVMDIVIFNSTTYFTYSTSNGFDERLALVEAQNNIRLTALTDVSHSRLRSPEARSHGFPDINFQMQAIGRTWDGSVYSGLREFHEAKGYDPYSDEVARTLGVPLYQLS
ncbi:hypothetical protein B0H14DRAFT_2612994 [Mycena olivaceomarginata]|nr:hypothetical protein B0H14DRAFT_2612994 [Mycena olivaceomarginata]